MLELFYKCAYDETETMSHTDMEDKCHTLTLLIFFIYFIFYFRFLGKGLGWLHHHLIKATITISEHPATSSNDE